MCNPQTRHCTLAQPEFASSWDVLSASKDCPASLESPSKDNASVTRPSGFQAARGSRCKATFFRRREAARAVHGTHQTQSTLSLALFFLSGSLAALWLLSRSSSLFLRPRTRFFGQRRCMPAAGSLSQSNRGATQSHLDWPMKLPR